MGVIEELEGQKRFQFLIAAFALPLLVVPSYLVD